MIQITQSPSTILLSAGNDNIYVVSGDTVGTANVFEYKYIADVFINDILQCTLKSFPDPQFGCGLFNIRNIVNSFISFDAFINPGDTLPLVKNCPNSSAPIFLEFGEEYVSGNTFVQNRNILDSDASVVINGSLSFPDQDLIQLDSYDQLEGPGSVEQLYLTRRPLQQVINGIAGRPSFLSYPNLRPFFYFVSNQFNASPTANIILNILTYSSLFQDVSTLIGNYLYNTGIPAGSGTDIMAVNAGQGGLSLLNAGNTTAIGGTFPIINPAVKMYVIGVQTFGQVGPYMTVGGTYGIISEDCGRTASDAYAITWLNEFGGFDIWLFNKKNETTQTKTTQVYKKVQGNLQSDGTYAIGPASASQQSYFTTLQDSIVMNTDLLTDKDVLFLKTLISSPVVFMTDSNGVTTAVTVQDNSCKINKRVNQKIYSLQMTVNQSYNDYRQIL